MPVEETIINFSPNESNLLKLNIGRCVSANFDEQQLLKQIIDNEYDICRLTVSSEDETAVTKLEKTGIPYYYSGSIARYKTLISELPERQFIHNDLEYEKYDGTQNDLLLQLLIGTWGTYPIGYYRTPFLNKLVTKEQEILCVFEFYKKHNLQKDYPNNTIMFIKHKGNYVGFFALNIIADRLESHIGGIVDPYREGGYFFDMQEYIRRFCIENKLNYFCFGARNENRRVNAIFQKYGYRAVEADNVFHIAPLLKHTTHEKTIQSEIDITSKDSAAIYNQILEKCKDTWSLVINNSIANLSFKMNNIKDLATGKYDLIVTFPVTSISESFMTIKIYNADKKFVSFGYIYTN